MIDDSRSHEMSATVNKILDRLTGLGCDRDFLTVRFQMLLSWCGVNASVDPLDGRWIFPQETSPFWSRELLQYGPSPRQKFTLRQVRSLSKRLKDNDSELQHLDRTRIATTVASERGEQRMRLGIHPDIIKAVDDIARAASGSRGSEVEMRLRQICMHVFIKTGAWHDELVSSLLGIVTDDKGKPLVPHTATADALKNWRKRRKITEEEVKK